MLLWWLLAPLPLLPLSEHLPFTFPPGLRASPREARCSYQQQKAQGHIPRSCFHNWSLLSHRCFENKLVQFLHLHRTAPTSPWVLQLGLAGGKARVPVPSVLASEVAGQPLEDDQAPGAVSLTKQSSFGGAVQVSRHPCPSGRVPAPPSWWAAPRPAAPWGYI